MTDHAVRISAGVRAIGPGSFGLCVPGIGLKTGAKLLEEFGDLETLLASTAKVSGAKRQENLRQYADQARLGRMLIALAEDLPMGAPSEDTPKQLRELHIRLNLPQK